MINNDDKDMIIRNIKIMTLKCGNINYSTGIYLERR